MLNAENKTLVFPHIIAGNKLAGKTYTTNNINGGMFPISKFNIIQHKFFGGNIEFLGYVSEFGFYICPDRSIVDTSTGLRKVNGFYIHDPKTITDLGKEVLQKHYPEYKIIYELVSCTPNRSLSPEEISKKIALIEEAKEKGVSPIVLEGASVSQIEDAIKIKETGVSGVKSVVTSGVVVADVESSKVTHKTIPQVQTIRRGVR